MKKPLFALGLAAVLGLAGTTAHAQAQTEQTRIYLANDDHTDYMWTTDADTYNAVFVQMLDYYLGLADQTVKNPAPYQSRFNADGSYWLWQYERQKTPKEFDRLMARIKDGHISAPLNTLVSCYGAQPTEAVLRGMYYAGRLERRYDVRFPVAIAMEDQTLPLGLSSLWAGSGAKYSWKGICGCVTKIPHDQLNHRPHEIYWYTGLDGQRVLMKWYSQGPNGIGGYVEADNPQKSITYLDSNPTFLSRYVDPKTGLPYSVKGAFGFGGDAMARKTGQPANPGIPKEPGLQQGVPGWPYTNHFFNIAKKQSNKDRQIIVSNTQDFFDDFAPKYGADLPSESVTYGNEWDLYSASMAETSARVRRSVEKLRPAELMATLVSLQKPQFLQGREKARDEAFTALGLYWEHDWTADGPVSRASRAAWQELLATQIEYYVDPLHTDSANRLGYLIQRPTPPPVPASAPGAASPAAAPLPPRFFVLNCLGSPRTDFADFAYTGSANIHVRDVSTGSDVPHQLVTMDGVKYLRIWASDVPPAGYKTYEILNGPETTGFSNAATVAATVSGDKSQTVENEMVKLTIAPDGAIASLVDKTRGNAELAGTIGGLKLNDMSPNDNSGTLTVENSGPVSITLRCDSSAGMAHTTWITLYRNSPRVDIRNRITENFGDNRYWSFGFNLAAPNIHTEELGTILSDRLKSEGGDYADTHARYDHVTLNHFADITNGAGTQGVTLSNEDCAFAKLGNSTSALLDTTTPQINVLAGGQIDGRYLGIQNQNGASNFTQRFSLRPHGAYDPVSCMRFALEHQNPLVTGGVAGTETSPYPATQYSLLTVSDPNVLLWAVKPSEDGIKNGVVARLWNMADAPAAPRVSVSAGVSGAEQVTHIETDIAPLSVTGANTVEVKMNRHQIQTLRLTMPVAPPAPTPKPK